jgi:hypothetical protein
MLSDGSKKNWIKSADVKTGDVVTFMSGGEWTESSKFTYDDGSPVKQFVVSVELKGEERAMNLNKLSRTNLCAYFGGDTDGWIGKKASVEKVKVMVGGELKESIMLTPIESSKDVDTDTEEDIDTENVPF